MEEPFKRFEWYVHPTYHWQDWLDSRGKPLVVRKEGLISLDSDEAVKFAWDRLHEEKRVVGPVLGPPLDSGPPRAYQPMQREHATLFRTFADLNYRDKEALLGFAMKFGLLGVETRTQSIPMPGRTGEDRYHHALGESYLDWAREICLMRDALHLARSRTPEEIATDARAYRKVGLEPPHDERRRRLAWLFNVHLQHVQGRMVFESELPPRLSFAPLTLLAAMWLQLALSVAGDKEFRACKLCRRLFEISTEQTGYRKHREFCSDSCKTLDYRKRKREALKLASDGRSAAAIAKQLKTSPTTIKAWLVGSRRREKGRK